MNIDELSLEAQGILFERLRSGAYQSEAKVLDAALRALAQETIAVAGGDPSTASEDATVGPMAEAGRRAAELVRERRLKIKVPAELRPIF